MIPDKSLEFWNNQALILECEDRATYNTRIIKIEEDVIFIEYPYNDDHLPMSQTNGKQVSACFYDDLNDQYVFETTLTYLNNKIYFAKPHAESIQKIQRRGHFRVPASLEIWVETEAENRHNYITTDISGGGVAFTFSDTAAKWEADERVTGGLYLDERSELLFSAKIINIRKDTNGSNRVSMAFTDMKEAEESKIISYCIKRQIELRNLLGKV